MNTEKIQKELEINYKEKYIMKDTKNQIPGKTKKDKEKIAKTKVLEKLKNKENIVRDQIPLPTKTRHKIK